MAKIITPINSLGDAQPSNVIQGVTFSSESGVGQQGTFVPSAENITYNNSISGIDATNVKDAIDKLSKTNTKIIVTRWE